VLTSEPVTDPSVACGVGCLNRASRQWDTDILNALNISPALFPVVESCAIAGRLKSEIATRVGPPAGLPVVAGGSDSVRRSPWAFHRFHLNRGSLGIGTSGHPIPMLTQFPQKVGAFVLSDGGYYLLGVTLAAGGSLRWYRDTFAPNHSYTELMDLIARYLVRVAFYFYPT